jgi:hypothetical protein
LTVHSPPAGDGADAEEVEQAVRVGRRHRVLGPRAIAVRVVEDVELALFFHESTLMI